MLVITGCGGCETEHNKLMVAFGQIKEQGKHSQVRSTLVRIMALFAAMHCFKTPSQELVEFRQTCCLGFKQHLATCMVGTQHTVGSWLCLSMCQCIHNSAIIYYTCLLYQFGLKLMSIGLASNVQAHLVKRVLLSTLPFSEDKGPSFVWPLTITQTVCDLGMLSFCRMLLVVF